MKKIIIISCLIILTGCKTIESNEWDIIPEYIDYNITTNQLVAFYNAFEKHNLNNSYASTE